LCPEKWGDKWSRQAKVSPRYAENVKQGNRRKLEQNQVIAAEGPGREIAESNSAQVKWVCRRDSRGVALRPERSGAEQAKVSLRYRKKVRQGNRRKLEQNQVFAAEGPGGRDSRKQFGTGEAGISVGQPGD
jgi:hypothetical protein